MKMHEEESNHESGRALTSPQERLPVAKTDLQTVGVHVRVKQGWHHLWIIDMDFDCTGLALSPDGRTLVTRSRGHTARAWDLASGRLLHTFAGHSGWVRAMALSADGRTLFTGSNDNTVRSWDVASGRLLHTFAGHTNGVEALALSADGRTLVTGGCWDHTVRAWDVASGRPLRTFEGHTGWVLALTLSPDGRTLVTGSGDHTARAWDLASGRLLRIFEGHSGWVSAMALSPDGRTLFTGSNDNTVRAWDVASGRLLHTFAGHTNGVEALALSADGRTLVTGSGDHTARAWDVASGRPLRTFEGHTGWVPALALNPDGRTLVTVSHDCTARAWALASGRLLRIFEGHSGWVSAMALSPDGRTLVTGGGGGITDIRIWDIRSGHTRCVIRFLLTAVRGHALSQDGKMLFTYDFEHNAVRAWDMATGRPRYVLGVQPGTGFINRSCMPLIVDPDHRLLFTGASEVARAWDIETGHLVRTYEGHAKGIRALAVSPDGRVLFTGSYDATVRGWEVETGRLLHVFEGHSDAVLTLAVSPDGGTLFSGGYDKTIRSWDARTARPLRTFEGHTGWVKGIAVSPDGRTAFSVANDGGRVWNASTGRLQQVFEKEAGEDCILSGDGNRLFVGGTGKLRLLDTASGQVLRTFESHTENITKLSIDPSGKIFFGSSWDGTVRAWSIETGELLVTLYQLAEGFLWATPPDEVARSGWFWTDHPELITVFKAYADGSERDVLADDDPDQLKYINDFNRQDIVMSRLTGKKLLPPPLPRDRPPKQLGHQPS